MPTTHQTAMVRILSRIDRQIAKAEPLTVARGDDDTLQRASAVLDDMREVRRDVEGKLRAANG